MLLKKCTWLYKLEENSPTTSEQSQNGDPTDGSGDPTVLPVDKYKSPPQHTAWANKEQNELVH